MDDLHMDESVEDVINQHANIIEVLKRITLEDKHGKLVADSSLVKLKESLRQFKEEVSTIQESLKESFTPQKDSLSLEDIKGTPVKKIDSDRIEELKKIHEDTWERNEENLSLVPECYHNTTLNVSRFYNLLKECDLIILRISKNSEIKSLYAKTAEEDIEIFLNFTTENERHNPSCYNLGGTGLRILDAESLKEIKNFIKNSLPETIEETHVQNLFCEKEDNILFNIPNPDIAMQKINNFDVDSFLSERTILKKKIEILVV